MTTPRPPKAAKPTEQGISSITRRAAGWAVLAILFYLLFKLVPPQKVFNELINMGAEKLGKLMALSIVFIAGVCLIDGTAMWYGFTRFKVPIKWREVFLVRTAMMLLASIATLIGQAGLAAHISRKYKIPPAGATGMVMFLFLLEIYGMVAVATVGLPLLLVVRDKMPAGAPVLTVALLIALVWLGLALLVLLARRGALQGGIFARSKLDALIGPLRTLSWKEVLALLGIKTVLAAWQISLTHVAFQIYGIGLSVFELFAFMPLGILVSSIPITPARLGTTQWSWTYFFSYTIAPSVLVAVSLLLQFLLNVARWILGAVALPFIYSDLVKNKNVKED